LSDEFERLVAGLSKRFITAAPEDVERHLEDALGLVGTFAGADSVTIGQRSSEGPFRRTCQWVRNGFERFRGEQPERPYAWSAKTVFVHGERLVLHRLDDLPQEAAADRASLTALGVKSLAVFPLLSGKTVIGALSLATLGEARFWPPELVDQLGLAADLFGAVLGRQQAHAKLTWHLDFERLIADVSATLVGAAPGAVDDYILDALARLGALLDLDRSVVRQREHEESRFASTHRWVREGHPEWSFADVDPEAKWPWMMARLGQGLPVIFARPSELPPEATSERQSAESLGPKATVILPLSVGGGVVGYVTFASMSRERSWPPDIVDRMVLFAQVLSSAIARKRSDVALSASLAENERLRERLEAENVYLQGEVKSVLDFDEIVGRSPAIRAVLHRVDQVAATDVPVLLLGETGTGKELIARALHERSGRSGRPLITVNCAALPSTLIESELFGHDKGAFTGATRSRPGRFELANGGTLLLDEIGDLELSLQAKLLRALQEGEIQRLGSSQLLKVNVRVIAATNRDLDAAIREGRFREDLYYRLGAFPIEAPPLRDRREDIPLLVWHFIQSRQRTLGRRITEIPDSAMNALVAYDWPGNVRELQSVIDRALILSTGPTHHPQESLRASPTRASQAAPPPETLRDAERLQIISVLERCGWIIEGRGQAADRLGLQPSTLRHRMRKLNIKRPPAP
jgi:transcriptional regulator with GAF, ATPase, and Fis domain